MDEDRALISCIERQVLAHSRLSLFSGVPFRTQGARWNEKAMNDCSWLFSLPQALGSRVISINLLVLKKVAKLRSVKSTNFASSVRAAGGSLLKIIQIS